MYTWGTKYTSNTSHTSLFLDLDASVPVFSVVSVPTPESECELGGGFLGNDGLFGGSSSIEQRTLDLSIVDNT